MDRDAEKIQHFSIDSLNAKCCGYTDALWRFHFQTGANGLAAELVTLLTMFPEPLRNFDMISCHPVDIHTNDLNRVVNCPFTGTQIFTSKEFNHLKKNKKMVWKLLNKFLRHKKKNVFICIFFSLAPYYAGSGVERTLVCSPG